MRVLELKMWFLNHKVAPKPHKRSQLAKSAKTNPKNFTFCSDREVQQLFHTLAISCSIFHQMIVSEIFRAQNEVSRSQIGLLAIKVARLDQTSSTIAQNTLLCALLRESAVVILVYNCSIFLKQSQVQF